MENIDVEISMEIGVLMFSMEIYGEISMEFHGSWCPNPPWNSMEKFPWKSMEFHGGFSHGLNAPYSIVFFCLPPAIFHYFLNCVPKITYLCSKPGNNETHTSKYKTQ